jgi:hypothetical protein
MSSISPSKIIFKLNYRSQLYVLKPTVLRVTSFSEIGPNPVTQNFVLKMACFCEVKVIFGYFLGP